MKIEPGQNWKHTRREWVRKCEEIERLSNDLDNKELKNLPCALIVVLCVVFAVIIIMVAGVVHAKSNDDIVKERIVNAIIGEAEGEPYKGKLAVACAIQNRVMTHGSLDKALRGVYGERAPRVLSRAYSSKTFIQAVKAYEEMLDVGACDFIDGADHWEGTSFKTPSWAKNMVKTIVIGKQAFYRKAR